MEALSLGTVGVMWLHMSLGPNVYAGLQLLFLVLFFVNKTTQKNMQSIFRNSNSLCCASVIQATHCDIGMRVFFFGRGHFVVLCGVELRQHSMNLFYLLHVSHAALNCVSSGLM